MEKKELDVAIENIRQWLFEYPKNEKFPKAIFALDVALCAKKLRESKIDNLTRLCIDYIA